MPQQWNDAAQNGTNTSQGNQEEKKRSNKEVQEIMRTAISGLDFSKTRSSMTASCRVAQASSGAAHDDGERAERHCSCGWLMALDWREMESYCPRCRARRRD